jgi:GNAT superfamily N-acetyltransferase
LRRIYQQSFGDVRGAELLFRRLYSEENCYVATVLGLPVAMAFALPVAIASPTQVLRGVYVYAVATHPRLRRRGLAAKVLAHIWEEAESGGLDFALLVPAEERLFSYYARHGYAPVGEICAVEFKVREAAGTLRISTPEGELQIRAAGCREYLRVREQLLSEETHLVWKEELLSYQEEMFAHYDGGFCLLAEGETTLGLAAYTRGETPRLDIQELLLPPDKMAEGLAALEAYFRPQEMRLRLPASYAQARGLTPKRLAAARVRAGVSLPLELYVALVMD